MSLMIELSPAEEARLTSAAQKEGIAPGELARRLVVERLPGDDSAEADDPMLALFARWEREDSAMTPTEIAEENRQWEEFRAAINTERDRAGARRVF